jgi:cytoskeletal protein RodZ
LMSATEEQLSTEQSRQDKRTRFRRRLIVGLWILVLAVSMTGWLVALAWIAYLLIKRLAS